MIQKFTKLLGHTIKERSKYDFSKKEIFQLCIYYIINTSDKWKQKSKQKLDLTSLNIELKVCYLYYAFRHNIHYKVFNNP